MIILESKTLEVNIDESSLTVQTRDKRTGMTWQMQENGPGDIGVKGHCGPWQGFAFKDAKSVKWEKSRNKLVAVVTGWPYSANVWAPLSFGLEITFELKDSDLKITVSPYRDDTLEASIIDSYYPRGFLFPEKTGGQLVLPYSQGCLLDKNFPHDLDMILPGWVGLGFTMPWWGQLAESGEGFIALTDTPDDIGFRINTDKACGQTVHPYWQASLGGLKYPRVITYRFFEKANVVKLAKEYRKHAGSRGQTIPLKQKAYDRPSVENLKGGMIISTWIMSNFENFKRPGQVVYMKFKEALRRYEYLVKKAGIKKAFAHIDGWGKDGYDFNHPDVLPPDERAGGWQGLKELSDGVKALGHGFLLHDNYSDFYSHTEAFKNPDWVMNLSGQYSESSEWLGGRQRWLCSQQAMKYAKPNFTKLQEEIGLDGIYIDCWTIGHLRECFNQRHPASRQKTREKWSEVFAMCQNMGWATSSESGCDWAVPVMDFCWGVTPEWIPHVLKDKVSAFGISIPLYALVWHDCITVPGHITQEEKSAVIKDGCETNAKTDMRLWTLLWGGIPSVLPFTLDNPGKMDLDADVEFIKSLKVISGLHEKVGFESMIDWRMLAPDGSIQQTSFSDGTAVTVNFKDKNYKIKINRKMKEGTFQDRK